MKKLALLLMLLATPAKAAAEPPARMSVTLTDEQIAMVKAAVSDKLKDPESARFTRIKAMGGGRTTTVCGILNAKNSYGGYVGRKPFATLLIDGKLLAHPLVLMPDDTPETRITSLCSKAGIDLTKD